jgi:hypothetical protein
MDTNMEKIKFTNEIYQHNSETGKSELVRTEVVEIDAQQIINDKEAELLKIYAEIEALKAQQNQ